MDVTSYSLAAKANKKALEVESLLPTKATISGPTGAIELPSGTTAERPSLGVDDRSIRNNTDTGVIEVWDGAEWRSISLDTDTVTNIAAEMAIALG